MTTTIDLDFTLQFREDSPKDGVAATLEGVAVPYGTQIAVGQVRESFAPGAFDVNEVIGRPLFWRHGEQIGRITQAHSDTGGLHVTADIADTTLGRDAATLARMGGMGLSVGFEPVTNAWSKTRDAVTRIKATLRELSLTPHPAYATAGVSTVREEALMTETIEAEATPVVPAPDPRVDALASDLQTMRTQMAAINVSGSDDPYAEFRQYKTLGEYSMAAFRGEVINRAAPDQVTSASPGVSAPQWMMDVKNIVGFGRPGINAVGVQSAGATGLDYAWPYFDGDLSAIVAAQSAQKAAVNTVLISIKKGTASLATYGAYSDISYQLLQRSQPSYLDAHNRIMLASYATVTDNVFVDALVAGGTASTYDYDFSADTTGATFRAAVFHASVEVETATGAPASVALVASDVFAKAGGWSAFFPSTYGTYNVSGTATASTLDVNVSGLRVVHDRNLASGSIVVTNGSAAAWIEDGPAFATNETPSKLGRDVAIYGFGVTAIYNAKGVVKITNLA